MLRKVSIVLSVVAALGLAVATSTPADAKKPDKNQSQNQNQNQSQSQNKNFKKSSNKNISNKKFIVGQKYNGHIWYGHNRHRWRGRWYAYGEGPCWIRIDGEWFWNILACPI